MVLLRKAGRRSIRFEFDRPGASDLIASFGEEHRSIDVLVDRHLLGGRPARRGGFVKIPFHVSEQSDRDMISMSPDRVTLELDANSIGYIHDRLMTSVPDGFSPAEMAEVSLDASDEPVMLYGEFKEVVDL